MCPAPHCAVRPKLLCMWQGRPRQMPSRWMRPPLRFDGHSYVRPGALCRRPACPEACLSSALRMCLDFTRWGHVPHAALCSAPRAAINVARLAPASAIRVDAQLAILTPTASAFRCTPAIPDHLWCHACHADCACAWASSGGGMCTHPVMCSAPCSARPLLSRCPASGALCNRPAGRLQGLLVAHARTGRGLPGLGGRTAESMSRAALRAGCVCLQVD